jgi:murein DD-endopeptidase MepM/ murein hydrolase activator NlpD
MGGRSDGGRQWGDMPELFRRAPFLRQTGLLIALIVVGLAATITPAPAISGKAHPSPESASLPLGPDATPNFDAALPPDISLARKVRKGDTLSLILTRGGADQSEAQEVIEALRKVHDPRKLVIGDEIVLTFERLERYQTGRLLSVELPAGTDYTVRAERVDEDSFKATKTKRSLSEDLARATGGIDSSFYLSGAKAGLNADMLAELVKIFSYDVDFQRDVHPGDDFDVLYQRVTDEDGAFVRRGDIVFAALTLSGVRHEVYRYRAPGASSAEYYNAKGESIRKALLRTPLDAIKITSPFGNRMHPIMGYTRKHKGVDFSAPSGTPIYAAGTGKVVEAGRNGGYGIYVRLHHDQTFDTAYGHMRALAKGIRPGATVTQGQVIGYVGTTGESTGPHLHYEVIQKGQQVNPLGVKFAGGRVLNGRELTAFAAERRQVERLLAAQAPTTKVGAR